MGIDLDELQDAVSLYSDKLQSAVAAEITVWCHSTGMPRKRFVLWAERAGNYGSYGAERYESAEDLIKALKRKTILHRKY